MQQEPFLLPPDEILTRGEEAEPIRQEQDTPLPVDEDLWQTEVIQRCLLGDEAAFAFITEQYGNLLLRTAYLLVRDEEQARDIVQEALLLAWKNLKQLREPTFLRSWLLKIVVNQALSFKRQLARKASLLHEQMTQYALDLSIYQSDIARGSREETVDIAQALSRLPDNQRVVLVLFYYQRMTMPEIASCLGVAENTLRKRLEAALDKMRRALSVDYASKQEYASSPVHSHMPVRRGGVV